MKRASRTSPVEPFERSDAWIEAFSSQCTERLYDVARRFAARRAAIVGWCGGAADEYYVQELVANVIGDTAAGILRWNPDAQSLEAHVLDAIAARSSHDCDRALRYQHEPVDVFDPEAPRTLIAEIEAKLAAKASGLWFGLGTEPTERMTKLRELAGSDDIHVLLILDAFEANAVTKSDVMHFTGLSDREYHAARNRLSRLVAKLSPGEPTSRPRLKKGA